MKKVLLISLTPCYPLYSGGALAQYYFIDGLKNEVEFVYCTEVHNDEELQNLNLLQEKQPALKIYSICSYKHSPQKTFKSIVIKLGKFLLGKKKTEFNNVDADDFDDLYFQHIDHHYSNEFISLINDVIKKEHITQVQLDFYDTIDLCFAIPKDIRKIFIHHELRFRRLQLAFDKSNLSEEYKKYLIKKTELFERACLQEMDHVVVFNQNDADLIYEDCKLITVSPFAIPDELIFKRQVSDDFTRLLFVGGDNHTPNILGLMWFLDEIYVPNIDTIQYPIYVVGSWSENFRNKYIKYPQIIFCGIVDSIEPYFGNSIFVNPILTGSGLRTKVLHAYVNKVPVLSTRFGAEGCFDENNNSHIVLFENEKEFLKNIQKYDFKIIAKNGFEYYYQFFNKENLLKIRERIYS